MGGLLFDWFWAEYHVPQLSGQFHIERGQSYCVSLAQVKFIENQVRQTPMATPIMEPIGLQIPLLDLVF